MNWAAFNVYDERNMRCVATQQPKKLVTMVESTNNLLIHVE